MTTKRSRAPRAVALTGIVSVLAAVLTAAAPAAGATSTLDVSPGELGLTADLDKSAVGSFTVTNASDTEQAVSLSELAGTFTPTAGADGSGTVAAKPKIVVSDDDGLGLVGSSVAAAGRPGTAEATTDATSADPWVDLTALPVPVMDNVAGTHDGKLYSFTGVSDWAVVPYTLVYDPSTETWSQAAPVPTAAEKPAGAFVGDAFYLSGGWRSNGSMSAATSIYDVASDSWSSGTAMPLPVAAAATVALDEKMYVIGGCQDACGETTVQVYDTRTDTWSTAADYPVGIAWQACGVLDRSIYCAGGYGADEQVTAAAYRYDVSSDTWTELPAMPSGLWGGGSAAAGGSLLVSGGNGESGLTDIGFRFDAETGEWSELPPSGVLTRRGASACGFYRIGGTDVDAFTGTTAAQQLPGYDVCGASVPWLAVDDAEFDLAPGESRVVQVTADSAGLDQPGTYTGSVLVEDASGDRAEPVAVTFEVTPPQRLGRVTGTLTNTCTGEPLAGATVVVADSAGSTTLRTGPDGSFARWIAGTAREATVIAARDGWRAATVTVQVPQGTTTTADLELEAYPVCP